MKNLKGIILFSLCVIMLSGCSKNSEIENKPENTQKVTEAPVAATDPTEAPIVTGNDISEDVEEEDTNATAEKIDMNIAVLKGATAIGMVKVMEDSDQKTTANNYQFSIHGTADEISAGLVKGEIDIAAVPCNLASVLYNKTEGKIKLAGINTLGVLYLLETGDTIKTVEDLKGKTIYSTGFGTTPQYTLNYLLSSYGIDPQKDVTIEYKTEATEVAAILSESTDAIAMLPQPYVTSVLMNNEKARIALDIAEEWDKVSTDGSGVVTGVVVVRKEFLESNQEAFDTFMEEYAASAAFANESIEEASTLLEKFDIFKAAVAKQAIPYCNITLIRGEEMKEKVSGYLNVLFSQNPKAVGGKLPADDFYYIP